MICKLGKKLDGQNVQFMKEILKYPRGPNTQSTLSSFLIKFGLYLSREKNKKEARIGPILKERQIYF